MVRKSVVDDDDASIVKMIDTKALHDYEFMNLLIFLLHSRLAFYQGNREAFGSHRTVGEVVVGPAHVGTPFAIFSCQPGDHVGRTIGSRSVFASHGALF